jgi:hypothetical protein
MNLINKILIGIVFFTYASCMNNKEQSNNKPLDVDMIGEWGLYTYQCNVCPRINYKNDHSADVINGIGEITPIKWSQRDDTLNIVNESNVEHIIIENGLYLMSLIDTIKLYQELKLINLKTNQIHTLRKSR